MYSKDCTLVNQTSDSSSKSKSDVDVCNIGDRVLPYVPTLNPTPKTLNPRWDRVLAGGAGGDVESVHLQTHFEAYSYTL